jgi:hypothetical protein
MEAFYSLPEERAKVSFQGLDNYSLLRLPSWTFEKGLISYSPSVEILKRVVFFFYFFEVLFPLL